MPIAALASAHLLLLALLASLYVNVPAGFNAAHGLHIPSIELFRRLWPYLNLELSAGAFSLAAALGFALLWASYLTALWMSYRDSTRITLRQVLIATAVLDVGLALYFPTVLSADIFHYALAGRLFGLHGMNPYVVPGTALSDDPFYYYAVWHGSVTQYGPTWSLLSAAAARALPSSVVGTVIAFKLLAAASHWLGALAIAKLAQRFEPRQCAFLVLAYGWHPVLLIESAASGHNDIVMIALGLVALALLVHARWFAAGALFAASILVKYVTGILLFFAMVALVERQRQARAGLRVLAGVATALTYLYLPFLPGLDRLKQLVAGLDPALNPVTNNVTEGLRRLLAAGFHGLPIEPGIAAAWLLNALFVAILMAQAWRIARSEALWRPVLPHFAVASLLYTYLFFGGGFAWYLMTPIPAALLAPGRARFYLMAVTTGLSLALTIPYIRLFPTP